MQYQGKGRPFFCINGGGQVIQLKAVSPSGAITSIGLLPMFNLARG
ncbi:hypothetical protein NBRC116589_38960 [Ruegeria sp. HU-ET01832]